MPGCGGVGDAPPPGGGGGGASSPTPGFTVVLAGPPHTLDPRIARAPLPPPPPPPTTPPPQPRAMHQLPPASVGGAVPGYSLAQCVTHDMTHAMTHDMTHDMTYKLHYSLVMQDTLSRSALHDMTHDISLHHRQYMTLKSCNDPVHRAVRRPRRWWLVRGVVVEDASNILAGRVIYLCALARCSPPPHRPPAADTAADAAVARRVVRIFVMSSPDPDVVRVRPPLVRARPHLVRARLRLSCSIGRFSSCSIGWTIACLEVGVRAPDACAVRARAVAVARGAYTVTSECFRGEILMRHIITTVVTAIVTGNSALSAFSFANGHRYVHRIRIDM